MLLLLATTTAARNIWKCVAPECKGMLDSAVVVVVVCNGVFMKRFLYLLFGEGGLCV